MYGYAVIQALSPFWSAKLSSANQMPLAVGERLGPYEITAPIRAGGMREVYRAHDLRSAGLSAFRILSHLAAYALGCLLRAEWLPSRTLN